MLFFTLLYFYYSLLFLFYTILYFEIVCRKDRAGIATVQNCLTKFEKKKKKGL